MLTPTLIIGKKNQDLIIIIILSTSVFYMQQHEWEHVNFILVMVIHDADEKNINFTPLSYVM